MKNYSILSIVVLLMGCDRGPMHNPQQAILSQFRGKIDMNQLPNYAHQNIPDYIKEDNIGSNAITDKGAMLGRILFYDKNLSTRNTISCGSCHKQGKAFGDNAISSVGINGLTDRHAMRLVNTRFSNSNEFFWDKRAISLEEQTTQPIRNHIEMGFSGIDGQPGMLDLERKLMDIDYYQELFLLVYGDATITEARIQNALAQFIRSIQSFDSRYDEGYSLANNPIANFPNFTPQENEGKRLFMQLPVFNLNGVRIGGGLGCNGCHRAPEFDIESDSGNNGMIGTLGGSAVDISVTRSPSLRDIYNPNGLANGPFMHTGFSSNFEDVLTHYNDVILNAKLDGRLMPNGHGQKLALTQAERDAVVAFMKTLSGSNIYIDDKWSDPFYK
jgi:cytochrome c peroxidase